MAGEDLTQAIDEQFHISPDAVNTDEHVHVLNHSNSFCLLDRWGNIYNHGKLVQGIYHQGTRFISRLILTINGEKPLLLGSAIKEDNDVLSVDLSNPFLEECGIQDNTVHIFRNQFVREGEYHEKINCRHFGDHPCSFTLNLSFNGDFKDIFEIRGLKRQVVSNTVETRKYADGISLHYTGLDKVERTALIKFNTSVPFTIEDRKVDFFVDIAPGESVNIHYCVYFLIGNQPTPDSDYHSAKTSLKKELTDTGLFAYIRTTNEQFNHWLTRSKIDVQSLLAITGTGLYPYAGVPWYNTPFGRDGIITAIETLWIAPQIAKNVLLYLAGGQAHQVIPSKDADPGKILHEARSGEMANTGEIPFREYYGTIDATPLFIMLAGMYYERTADLDLIKEIWPNIKAAINWIDLYGDLDGDGFVEYQHKADNGLTNQGWKDPFDSIMYEDGQMAEPPIALVEVQAYVYGAKRLGGVLADHMQEKELSQKLIREAETLKKRFNERFWDDSLNCYVLALDAKKQPCRVISSNAGHCLFTKIADDDKAEKLAETLLSEDMFSGWGIRTLSAKEKRFNPMSYHNGSVWPHDNALIAYGLSLYGLQEHTLKIMQALFEASLFISLQRMPELYCGFNRRSFEGPTSYPVACSPQAWSVAVVFMLLQACFRLEIDAPAKTVTFDKPILPEYLDYIYIEHLKLPGGICNLQMKRFLHDVGFNVLEKPADWDIIIKK